MSFPENKDKEVPNSNSNSESELDESNQSHEPGDVPVPHQTDEEKISGLQAELETLNAKLVETHERMLRIAAQGDNNRKRLEKEKMETRIYSIQEFARDLLPVIDAVEKSLQLVENSNQEVSSQNNSEQNVQLSIVTEGIKLVSKVFYDVIKKHGIERLPGKGAPFNPMFHNAISKVADSSYETETVIEEFLSGYKIGDRILRTALVKVGIPD